MSYQNQSFGMMDEGYFVPRGQILNWLNDLLKLNLTKIQQLGSGAVYCQVVDVIHPGKVALSKLNWKARSDYQFINNLKILQNSFDKIGIKKHVEVERLAKAKYQDNLQFIQWLKRYYDLNCGERGSNYQAEERRGNAVVDLSFADKTVVPKTYNATGAVNNAPTKVQPKKTTTTVTTAKTTHAKQQQSNPINRVKSHTQIKKPQTKKQITSVKKIDPKQTKGTAKVQQKVEEGTSHEQHRQKQLVQTDPKLEAQLQQAFADLEQAKHVSESHQDRAKQAQMKLEMIKEILHSEDAPDMKVSLIQEIFKE